MLQLIRDRQVARLLRYISAMRARRLELIDVGQHLRHGQIQAGGYFLIEFGVEEQRARQRRSFEYRYLVFCGHGADAPGEQVGAFGDDARRAHLVLLIAQRHRIVSRVGDDDVAMGTFSIMRRRAISRCMPRCGLDLRPAFQILALFLDVLLGHAQLAGVIPELERTSTAAIAISETLSMIKAPVTRCPECANAAPAIHNPGRRSRPNELRNSSRVTPPTSKNFTSDFNNSTRPFQEKTFFIPTPG